MFWTVAGWILWTLVALHALRCILSPNRDAGVRYMMFVNGVVLALGVVATAVFPVSKFHLLWVLPVAYIIPMIMMSVRAGSAVRQFKALADEARRSGVTMADLIERKKKREGEEKVSDDYLNGKESNSSS